MSHLGADACVMSAQVPEKLPEEFAPQGPRLSRFRILPAPAIRPRLFPDEARFALRLAAMAGFTELAAWAWVARAGGRGAAVIEGALRLLRPVWAGLGTPPPRPAVAFALLEEDAGGPAASLLSVEDAVSLRLSAA